MKQIRTTVWFFALFYTCTAASAAAQQPLTSPAYADYNTFLGMINILELTAVGSRSAEAQISVYRLDGSIVETLRPTIEPGQQVDVIIDDVIGHRKNTYGVVKIVFNSTNRDVRLIGRMSYYRQDENAATYSYVFSRQLNNPISGTSYAAGNSYDPQGRGYLVPNWLQVTNLSSAPASYTVNLYDHSGTIVAFQLAQLAPFERRDFAAGHEQGTGVYLNEIIPSDPSAPYIAAVSRYGSNSSSGSASRNFSFAFALESLPGSAQPQYALLSNQSGDCFSATNWLEVVNASGAAAEAVVNFYRQDGVAIGSSHLFLPPRSQMHLNGSALLPDNAYGSAHILPAGRSAIVAQSTVYVHSCRRNALQTAFVLPAAFVSAYPIFGSYNRFLGMQNDLLILNLADQRASIDATIRTGSQTLFSSALIIPRHEILALNLNDEAAYGTTADTYGSIELDDTIPGTFVAFNLRSRISPEQTLDFVNPTEFR